MNATEYEMTDSEYREVLDEIYGDVEICGMSYSSGRALEELDPTAFRCGKLDYCDGKYICGKCEEIHDSMDEAEECCKEDAEEEEEEEEEEV